MESCRNVCLDSFRAVFRRRHCIQHSDVELPGSDAYRLRIVLGCVCSCHRPQKAESFNITRFLSHKKRATLRRDSFFYAIIKKDLLSCDFLVAVNSAVAKFLLDAEKLVVFSHTVRTACRTSLDLARVHGNCEVGDSSVLSFA